MNLAKHFNLKSIIRWTYVNHSNWSDNPEYSVITVIVERVTTLNGEVISSKIIERQDHVVNVSTAECMAAAAYLRMNSINNIDEEVYVGF